MCEFFSAAVVKTLEIRWYWGDSHEVIIEALGLDDSLQGNERQFVRLECPRGDLSRFREDGADLPRWYVATRNKVYRRTGLLLQKIVERQPELDKVYGDLPGYICGIVR